MIMALLVADLAYIIVHPLKSIYVGGLFNVI